MRLRRSSRRTRSGYSHDHGRPRARGQLTLELRYLSAEDVARVAPAPVELVAAVEEVVRAQGEGRVVLEPRVHLEPGAEFRGHWNVLRAFVEPLGLAGVKVVGDFVDNYRHGLPSELGLLTLYDPSTGAPTAIVDAADLTDRRTGALTAVGARHLARRPARVLGHVGARGTAYWNVVLLDALCDFQEIRVTSRRPESRDAFARRLEEDLGKPVRACATVRETVEGADVVVEATRLVEPEPILRTAWIAEGAFVVPYGTISAVELDLLSIMDKVVVDDWAQCRPGNRFGSLRPHVDARLLSESTLYGELGEIVSGRKPGREHDGERILFWHRGLATCDVALGALLVDRAAAAGVGTVLRYR
jgi:ornithine cyclodeaminase/alanine dehydrogenase-like protein (mu-crystallin family)